MYLVAKISLSHTLDSTQPPIDAMNRVASVSVPLRHVVKIVP